MYEVSGLNGERESMRMILCYEPIKNETEKQESVRCTASGRW